MTTLESYNIDSLEPLLLTLRNTLGVVVADDQRIALVERIEPLLSSYNIDSFATLANRLSADVSDELKSGLFDAISQARSKWDLSAEIHGILHNYIFDQLDEGARVWIVGCEQGQLAYAIAMEIAKYEKETGKSKHFQLVATDVPLSNIHYAKQGTYTRQQLRSLDDNNRKLFVDMSADGKSGTIKQRIRQSVDFRQCDLTEDFQSLGAMDIIICPEVLVYFSNDRKAGIFKQCSSMLKPGGIFLTDNSQSMMMTAGGLERVDHPAGMFFRKKAA